MSRVPSPSSSPTAIATGEVPRASSRASPADGGVVGVSVPQGDRVATWYTQAGDSWLGHAEVFMPTATRWVGGSASGLLAGGHGTLAGFVHRRAWTPVELWRDGSLRGDYSDAAVAVGHLDADGLVDLAAASTGRLSIFRGLADGRFERVANLVPGRTPEQVLIAEVTGDADGDVVLIHPHEVRVVRGGTHALGPAFTAAIAPYRGTVVRAGADAPAWIAAAPTRELDLAAKGVSLLRFAADGAVAEEVVVAETLGILDAAGADLDGDAADELLVFGMHGEAPVLTRWAPDGAGFVAGPEHDLAALSGVDAASFGFTRVSAGDTDEDGAPEVWIPTGDGIVRIDGVDGDAPIAEVIVEDAVFPFTELRDVDGDGHLDQLGVQVTGDFVFRPGAGDGTFTGELDGYDFPFPAAGVFAAAGAQVDVVTVSQDGVAAHRLREVPRIEPVGGVFGYLMSGTSDIAIGDIDRDGADDVVAIAGAANGGIAVLWGGAGGLARMDVVASPIETKGLTLADLDGDGSPEVVTSNGISRIEANRFWPRREALFVPLALGTLDRVHDLLVQDVDGDGRLDVLALFEDAYGGGGARLAVTYGLAGDEDPPYTEWTLLLAAPELGVASLAAADVNDDGRVDLLVRPSERGASVLLLNEGPRAWSAGVTIAGESAALVDAPDGADLLVQAEGKIRRFEVAGAELVARETLLEDATLTEGRFVRAAEIDGDEPVDLIVQTATLTTIWIDAGRGYAPWLRISTDEMKRVDVGDFDGDGRTDLIGRIDGRVAVRLSGDDAAP
jgi:hypothetical protein